MDSKFFDFEQTAFKEILKHNLRNKKINTTICTLLDEQHNNAKIEYQYTGKGFFFNYIVQDVLINKNVLTNNILGGIEVHSSYLDECGVELILFIKDGKISLLEGQGYGMDVNENFVDEYMIT